MQRATSLILTGMLMLSIGACSQTDDTSRPDRGENVALGAVVEATNNEFSPPSLEVEVGEEVTWRFSQGTHDVVFSDAASEILSEGTWQRVFEEAGSYEYVCSLHSGMTGVVNVVAAN